MTLFPQSGSILRSGLVRIWWCAPAYSWLVEARGLIYPLILDIIQPWEQDSSLVNNRPIREIADPSIVIEDGTGSLSRPSQKAENDGLMKNKEQNRFWTNKVAKFSVCDALKLFPKTLLISAPSSQNPVPPFDRLSRPFRELFRLSTVSILRIP